MEEVHAYNSKTLKFIMFAFVTYLILMLQKVSRKATKSFFFRVQNFFLFSCIVPVFVMSDNLCLFLAVNGCKFCKCCSQTKTQGKQVLSDEEAGFECIEENLLDSLQEVSVDSFGHYISINDNKSKNKHIKSRHQNNSVSSVQNQIWQLR